MKYILAFAFVAGVTAHAETIRCNTQPAITVVLSGGVYELPLGESPAQIEGIPLLLAGKVDIAVNPIFHYRQVGIDSAYCRYSFNIDEVDGAAYMLATYLTCEGHTRELDCGLD